MRCSEEPLFKDTVGEKKWGIKFEDVLARARAGKVFEGKTFYITPKVEPSMETLKRIIIANGGEVGFCWLLHFELCSAL